MSAWCYLQIVIDNASEVAADGVADGVSDNVTKVAADASLPRPAGRRVTGAGGHCGRLPGGRLQLPGG